MSDQVCYNDLFKYIYIIIIMTVIVLVHAGSTMDPMSMETKELGCAVSSAFE